ncbi:YggS family pyridoxal phosphate-dependent enzyme [Saccharospirillum impatiens]|uniref:YggS family pyridoxal phosphate-dependent enzyme n=1 Tax=Saccharospirillum impatiens TaxID=169438 RepID=UPI0003FF56BE|nr:YggS family pyridoxal phosphate-dependent enzyme [Saccharospirillum impatiens]
MTAANETPFSDRLADVKARIAAACARSGRSVEAVTLVAVSKTWPLADLQSAVAAGVTDLGENYVQEAVDKVNQWQGPAPVWHFIGPLQSNKTRPIAELFDWVHSVDRLKIARRLSEQRPSDKGPLSVCIQVNISNDPAKAGVAPAEVEGLLADMAGLDNLTVAGLMAIPALDLDDTTLRQQYSELKTLRDTLITTYPDCKALSMGMSGDFELAIECGATHVRVGSALFGQRTSQPKD